MKQGQVISQTQKQTLRLAPQQVRFVRMLEMSGPEIEDEVRRELDDNPALESTDPVDVETSNTDHDVDRENDPEDDNYHDDEPPTYMLRTPASGRADSQPYVQPAPGLSMTESLQRQLDTVDAPPRTVALARYLVGELDDNGRMPRPLSDIATDIAIATGIDVSRQDVVEALDVIRWQLDPPGIGAVDLRECLLIQLRRRRPVTLAVRAATEIVADHFDLLAKRHFDRLQSALGIDRSLLDEAIALIVALDPKPGAGIGSGGATDASAAIAVAPDFYVAPIEGESGRFSVSLLQHVPSLGIEETFRTDGDDPRARLFVRRKRDEAQTFISLMERRTSTLLTVMRAIVALQRDFFATEDPADIHPMILRDVADVTGLDLSVISRATSTKYVATPAGQYPLKMFFNDRSSAVSDDDSETTVAEVCERLREVIDGEDKRHPLSDRILTDRMNALGYNLARRTVAKYRERMNIPVARLRRET